MKKVLLSILFLFFEIILAIILNSLLFWALDNLIFDLLNWFNTKSLLVKILLIFIGGSALIYLILNVIGAVMTIITQPLFNRIPTNVFTILSATAIAIVNSIFGIYQTWSVVQHFTFWPVIELIMLSLVILSLNLTVLTKREFSIKAGKGIE